MSNAAGWYPQPDGQQRYWDGEGWTENFAPGGVPVPPVGNVTGGKPARPWFRKKRVVVPVIALAAIFTMTKMGGGSSSTSKDVASPVAVIKPAVVVKPADGAEPAKAAPAPNAYDEMFGTFAVISESGRGDAMIRLPKGVKAGQVTATHSGSENFQISGLDASNQLADGLVNEIGKYSGTTAYGLLDLASASVRLKVHADGAWTVKISPFSKAAVLSTSASGHGDKVFAYNGGIADFAMTHKGSSNFMVQQYGGGNPNMGVNEIGNYSGTVPFVKGPTLIEIRADGTWTIKRKG